MTVRAEDCHHHCDFCKGPFIINFLWVGGGQDKARKAFPCLGTVYYFYCLYH